MITVRSAQNWRGEKGYRWLCSECPRHGGFHHFDRFTDRIRRKRGQHPWARAMASAVCHYHIFHTYKSREVLD